MRKIDCPRVTRETILARLEGVHDLHVRGVCAAYLWGYCATGNVVTPFDRHRFGLVLPEWDRSQEAFRAEYPRGVDRDECLARCVALLQGWLREVSQDVAARGLDHVGDVIRQVDELVSRL